MPFVSVCKVSDVDVGTMLLVEAGGREIAISNVDGKLYAIDDVCTHAEGSLSQGYLEECEVECPVHGARFDVRTGEVMGPPAALSVDSFPVRIVGDDVEIDM